MEPQTKRRRVGGFDNHAPRQSSRSLPDPSQQHHESSNFNGVGIATHDGSFHVGGDIYINSDKPGSGATNSHTQELLDSLRFEQMDTRQSSIKKAHAQTCRWFLKNPLYEKWEDVNIQSDDDSFLWIKGKPGAGKSTLMKFLRQQLQQKIAQEERTDILISFFFNARGSDMEKSTNGMYQSLLFQLLEAHPESQVVLRTIKLGSEWNVELLKDTFEEAIKTLGQTSVFCLIDALDECEESQIRDMIFFLNGFTLLEFNFHICFASRHYPHISQPRGCSITLESEKDHGCDIASYIQSRLLIGSSDKYTQISSDIQQKASGVFMWVVLVVDILNERYDAGDGYKLLDLLRELPNDLHQLFHNILTRDSKDRDGLLLCIQWILFAKQPLTPKQLYLAVLSRLDPYRLQDVHTNCTDDDVQKYILNKSKGLTEPTKSKKPTVQFIHESVSDFLLKDDGLSKVFPHLVTNIHGYSHEALKQCCLAYIKWLANITVPDLRQMHKDGAIPFLEYADLGVLYHAEQAGRGEISQKEYLANFPRAEWVELHNIMEKRLVRRYTRHVSLLYILAEAGMPTLIRALPEGNSCFKMEYERYGLPILAAISFKNQVTAQVMLEIEAGRLAGRTLADICPRLPVSSESSSRNFKYRRNIDKFLQVVKYGSEMASLFLFQTEACDVNAKDAKGRSVVMYAAERDYGILTENLIQNGVDILVTDERECNLLHIAAESGAIEVAKLLIARDAGISAPDNNSRTPLHFASLRGHIEVARLLIASGADISAATNDGWTPLYFAISRGHIEVAELLIAGGADISAATDNGWTPLHCALLAGYIEVAKLLIAGGANISAATNDGWTPLYVAVLREHIEVAKLLIAGGADISAASNDGSTPLHLASSGGYIEVAQLLIASGANISATNNHGRTPLYSASSGGHIEVVKLLIAGGADISAASNDGSTPLHPALLGGHIEVAKLLIADGADISAATNDGWTPLHFALLTERIEVAKVLIAGGADILAATNDGWTPLHSASLRGLLEVAKLLIAGGTSISATNNHGWTPLHSASSGGHIEVVKLLITGGADISAASNDGSTPLHFASSGGHIEVAKLLIASGANVSATDNHGRTSLFSASLGGHIEVAKLLIASGANISATDNHGRTPLHSASSGGHIEVAKLLIASGANISATDNHSRTPLYYGSEHPEMNVLLTPHEAI